MKKPNEKKIVGRLKDKFVGLCQDCSHANVCVYYNELPNLISSVEYLISVVKVCNWYDGKNDGWET